MRLTLSPLAPGGEGPGGEGEGYGIQPRFTYGRKAFPLTPALSPRGEGAKIGARNPHVVQ